MSILERNMLNNKIIHVLVIQISLLAMYIFGSSLIGYNHLYAVQSVSYPPNGTIEVTNDFPAPLNINPDPQQGGDGFKPIPTKDKVYAIYHHSYYDNSSPINIGFDRLDVYCIVKISGSPCTGFPKALTLNGEHAMTEDGSSFGIVDYHDVNNPKVYFGAATNSSSGIACLDLTSGNECGYIITDNTPPPSSLDFSGTTLRYPNIYTLPYGNELDFNNFDGTIYYLYNDSGVSKVGCKEITGNTYGGTCNVPTVSYPNLYRKLVSSYGDKAYVPATSNSWTDINNSPGNLRIVCYDKATNTDCGSGSSGWDTGNLAPFANIVPIAFPDINKVCIGLTGAPVATAYSGPNKFSCVDLTSGSFSINSTGNANADGLLNQIFVDPGGVNNVWFPSYINDGNKERLFLSNTMDDPASASNKDMYCWDMSTHDQCQEFSGGLDWSQFMTNPASTEDYSYTGDRYTNYRCAWALGDEGYLIPFRLDGNTGTGGCLSTTTNITVDLNDYLCEPERGIIKSISLEGVDLSLVDTGVAILTDQNDNPIPISGGSNEVDLKGAGGQVDISSLNLKYVKIQGQLVLNTLNQWDNSNPPKLKVVVEPNTAANNLLSSNCPIDLTAQKTSNFDQLAATAGVGTEFEYTITFTNNGPNDAYNAKVTDTLPAGNIVELSGPNPFSYTTVPASTTVNCSPSASSTGFSCDINKMTSITKDPNAKVEIKVKAKLTSQYLNSYLASNAYQDANDFSLHAAMDTMTNSVSIAPGIHPVTGAVQPDTNNSNNNDSVTDQPEASDIEVIKLISPIGGGGVPLLREVGATPGWAILKKKYITPAGQVYISQDISPNTNGWDIQKVDYMIFVINRGPNTQKDVALQDTRTASDGNDPLTIDTGYGVLTNKLSSNPSYGTITPETVITGVTATTTTINWPVGDLAPGEAKGMFYRVNYSDDADTYSNIAENVTPGPDRDPDSDPSNCNLQAPSEDDCDSENVTKNAGSLVITKSVSPTEVNSANQEVNYTIKIRNNGSKDYSSNDYSVTDTLPVGLDYVSSTPLNKCSYNSTNRTITCTDLGSLNAGNPLTGDGAGEITIEIKTKTNSDVESKKDNISNLACVIPEVPTMGTVDGKLCDDAEIKTTTVDLELTKTIVGSQGVYVGDEMQYEITLTNKGPGTAENVVIKESYPPKVQFVSALPDLGEYNSSTHEWTVLTIGPGQTIKLRVNVKILDYSDSDDRINRAEIIKCQQGSLDCTDTDSNPNNCDSGNKKEDDCSEAQYHEPVHDIQLTKSIVNQADTYKVGDTLQYVITLTNKGPDTAKNIVIKESMPSELEYLYHEAPVISLYDQDTHEWIVRSITSGQSLELKITVRITKFASSLTNIAEWVGCKTSDGKEAKCGKDPNSTPNNCDSGKKKEDDCADVTVKLSAGGKGIGIPITGALVGKIIAGATGISLAAYLGRDLMLRYQKRSNSER